MEEIVQSGGEKDQVGVGEQLGGAVQPISDQRGALNSKAVMPGCKKGGRTLYFMQQVNQ